MKNGSNPAYPYPVSDPDVRRKMLQEPGVRLNGLTKRELFAAMALQGLLGFSHEENVPNLDNVSYCAKIAVIAADELLKQLEL